MTRKHRKVGSHGPAAAAETGETEVRIIGGKFRGRRLQYHGDPVVRPMKHRTREAIFNLLSTDCTGRHAVDLFAGTGALGLEALSRGAAMATFIEKHVPSARIVEQNIRTLGVEELSTLCVTSAFLWAKRDLPSVVSNAGRTILSADSESVATDTIVRPTECPLLVFCSPPYAFYHERQNEMLGLIDRIKDHAPVGSILVVEADERLDFELLRRDKTPINKTGEWDVRAYSPALIGILRMR
jgi:16S rRNA (guanine966-N2)-methyltransferase